MVHLCVNKCTPEGRDTPLEAKRYPKGVFMLKGSFVGLIVTATVIGACTGEIGGLSGGASPEEQPDLIVPTMSVSNGWRSIEASEAALRTLEFEVWARPGVDDGDASVVVGSGDMSGFSDAPIEVRFANDGFIKARNGSVYDSDNAYPYRPRRWYRIRITADLPTRTYDVNVHGSNGRRGAERSQTLIRAATFSSDANETVGLTYWAGWSSQDAELQLAGASWTASGSCAPSTCESLGVECGQPIDGCGVSLNCGRCANDQTCDSGVCVCARKSCLSLDVECGSVPDGCGSTLSCGDCAGGQVCSDGICVEVSPPPPTACIPDSCSSLGVQCGMWTDGCGGTLNCGGCASGQSCASGVCVDVSSPPPPSCEPQTCLSRGLDCGTSSDGCGATLSCGSCRNGEVCRNGTCTCTPATCSSLGIECGQLSDGCGGTLNCGGCPSGQTCATGGICVDVPPPPPPPPPGESRGRGPSGQWPTSQGFPAYATSAELTTNGTMSGLRSSIESAACSDGCVIEHAGAISGNITSRAAGTGRIVIRPPIGERAEHAVNAEIQVDNLLIAGYGGGAANIGAGQCVNCGYAWIESRAANGHGSFSASCGVGASERLESIWYEIVFANYADWGQDYDRGGMYGVPNEVSDCRMLIRGWYIAGVTCPDNKPPGINCHSDTIQEVLWPGSTCVFEIHDSIFWPSEDKVMQTSSWDSPCNSPADVYNSTFISPPYAESLWTGDPISYNGSTLGWYPPGPQPFHTTANVHFRDSTLIGACYPQPGGFDIRVDDSELYDAHDCPQDSASSGNTILSSLPSVPGAPTHTQLDAIWSP